MFRVFSTQLQKQSVAAVAAAECRTVVPTTTTTSSSASSFMLKNMMKLNCNNNVNNHSSYCTALPSTTTATATAARGFSSSSSMLKRSAFVTAQTSSSFLLGSANISSSSSSSSSVNNNNNINLMMSTSSIISSSKRGGYWDASSSTATSRQSETEEQLRQQLPDVFEEQVPQQMDDYIRPDKTIFEKLEDYWDYAQSLLNPVQKQLDWMRGMHDGSLIGIGFEWGAVFLMWGFLVRVVSLGPMLYAHRNQLRMARIQPQVNEITMQQKRIKADKTLSSAEKRVMKEGYKRMEKAIYKKHQCSQKRAFVGALSTPVMISAFVAIRRLAMYEDSLETASFMWVTDLTMPDPYNILPVICTVLFVYNFEMNQSSTRGGRSATMLYIRYAMRVGSVVFLYFFSSQPTALFAYWIGMSVAGSIQPLLLRWMAFRNFFNFPAPNKVASQHQTLLDKLLNVIQGKSMTAGTGVAAAEAEAAAEKHKSGATAVGSGGQTLRHIRDEEVLFEDDDLFGSDTELHGKGKREAALRASRHP